MLGEKKKKKKSVGRLVLRLRWCVKVVTGLTRRSCSSVNIVQFATLYVYFTDMYRAASIGLRYTLIFIFFFFVLLLFICVVVVVVPVAVVVLVFLVVFNHI